MHRGRSRLRLRRFGDRVRQSACPAAAVRRVDRDGRLAEGGTPAPSIILALSSELNAGDDPVYGPALAATWAALEGREALDFGIAAFDNCGLGDDERLSAPPATAPYVLPAHLDAWVQTQPTPTPDPDPALWLHGLDRPGVADVQVIWRADVTEDFLNAATSAEDPAEVVGLVTACPPCSGETMPLPITAVRAWLAQSPTSVPVADVEGAEMHGDSGQGRRRTVVRWRAGNAEVVRAQIPIVPGDVLVVPAAYGGIDAQGNWDPESAEPVTDLGHNAQVFQRHRVVLRLVPTLWREATDLPLPSRVLEDMTDVDVVLAWLADRKDDASAQHCVKHRSHVRVQRASGPAYRRVADARGDGSTWAEVGGTAEHFVVSCLRPFAGAGPESGTAYDPEGDESTFTAREVELEEHLRGVERWARHFARECGLSPELTDDLGLAGRLHDVGKADPRFQVILYGGDEIGAASGRLLAKSGLSELERRRQRRAREQSGYPWGTRHELMSLALIEGRTEIERQAHDWDLVRYLVSSHHGWCRPLAPAVLDPEPRSVHVTVGDLELTGSSDHGLARLDAGVPDRFWSMVRRYGPHGLAWLEAVFQLADHHCSAEEQATVNEPSGGRR